MTNLLQKDYLTGNELFLYIFMKKVNLCDASMVEQKQSLIFSIRVPKADEKLCFKVTQLLIPNFKTFGEEFQDYNIMKISAPNFK